MYLAKHERENKMVALSVGLSARARNWKMPVKHVPSVTSGWDDFAPVTTIVGSAGTVTLVSTNMK